MGEGVMSVSIPPGIKVSWQSYNKYSGPLIRSNVLVPAPVGPRSLFHIDRAYWLTAKVETGGTFGTVMAYDGTGMTAGPDQHIAVYPTELANEDFNPEDDQGGLWQLVRRLETVGTSPTYLEALQTLQKNLLLANLYVGQDGKVRYKADATLPIAGRALTVRAGSTTHGAYLRDLLTPIGGKVPKVGPNWTQASNWALTFHKLFAHPDGYKAQLEFGKEHLVQRTKGRKIPSGAGAATIEEVVYQQELTNISVGLNGFTPAVDLALCVFQSHSVNAPAIAITALKIATEGRRPLLNADFAKKLIAALGNNTYGLWNDNLPNGRYQRTRDIAMRSSLWSKELFEGPLAVMPKNV